MKFCQLFLLDYTFSLYSLILPFFYFFCSRYYPIKYFNVEQICMSTFTLVDKNPLLYTLYYFQFYLTKGL